MNPTESKPDNISSTNATEETTQVSPMVSPPPSLEVPMPAQNTNTQQPSVSTSNASGLTSFPPNESVSMNTTPTSSSHKSVSIPIESIAKKEVVTRPLLWGVVTFLFFTGLVIGGVSLWRLYREQNLRSSDTIDTTISAPITETSTTPANIIENTPDTANPSIQADAIDAEVQAIDTDIEPDALSDTQLGL